MKHTAIARRRQRGVAHIEFALILPAMLLLLVFTVFFGRLFWHYTVAVKAASDIATFVALARPAEMVEATPDLAEVGIVKLARTIGTTELAELNPGRNGRPVIDITCDGGTCRGEQVPVNLVVMVRMRMYDPFFSMMTALIPGTNAMWLHAEVRVRYAGS